MILTFFEKLLLGHLVGDYLLQNNWMAGNKTSRWLPCYTHCLIYTLAVCFFTGFNLWWALIVFVSHFPIDRWSLADKWGQLIRGRSLKGFVKEHEVVVKTFEPSDGAISGSKLIQYPVDAHSVLQGGFTCLVYVVIDNTFHILLMVGGMALLKLLGVM